MTDSQDLIREIQEHTSAHGGENTSTHLLVQAALALQRQADELAAIGAGGVSGPLIGQPQAMPDLSQLTERGAKAWAGVDAQGLREGAANAGSEPVAQPSDAEAILSKICDLFHIGKVARTESTILTNIRNVIDHAGLLHAVERDLFPQPELPEDDDPYAAVDEGLPAPNSWAAKDEADYVAQFRAALAARGFTHPSPPEGMVGGWQDIATAPKDGTSIIAYRPSSPPHIECMNWCAYEDADIPGAWHWAYDGDAPRENPPTHWMPLPLPPTTSAGSGKGD